jgi:hypothetical protein
MPNPYYNYNDDLIPGSKARSLSLDNQFEAIEDGFDKLGDFGGIGTGTSYNGTDTGTANTVVVDNGQGTPLVDGQIVTFTPAATNTGPTTLALNGTDALPVVRNDGSAMQAGDLLAGVTVALIHDADTGDGRWIHIGATAEQCINRPAIKTITANYTLTAADEGSIIVCNNSGNITVTIPAESTTALKNGYLVHLYRYGLGEVAVAGAAGVAVRTAIGPRARNRYSSISPAKTGTDDWLILGDAKA